MMMMNPIRKISEILPRLADLLFIQVQSSPVPMDKITNAVVVSVIFFVFKCFGNHFPVFQFTKTKKKKGGKMLKHLGNKTFSWIFILFECIKKQHDME
jgi:hypothetical protein